MAAPSAIRVLSEGGGDWGDVPPGDAKENDLSVREGFRIVSSYTLGGERI